jgi:hypothetical protein
MEKERNLDGLFNQTENGCNVVGFTQRLPPINSYFGNTHSGEQKGIERMRDVLKASPPTVKKKANGKL